MPTSNEADIRTMREFIMQVDAVPPAKQRSVGAVNTNVVSTEGFVNSGAIQVLGQPLPPQQKADAQNWILFGQLAADRAAVNDGYDRVSDPEKWYGSFIDFLSRVGMHSGGYTRKIVRTKEIEHNAAQTALHLLKPYLTSDDQVLVDNVFRDLELPVNELALKTFNDAASRGFGANFLVLGASVDRFLNLTIQFTCMDFQTEDLIENKNALYWDWNKDKVKCYYGKDTLTLPKAIADRLRSALFRKIEPIRGEHIIPVRG